MGWKPYLVGGFKHVCFHHIWDNPSNWLSYFSRWLKPLWRLSVIYSLIGGLEQLDYFSIQLGMSSSQLTNSLHHFTEGLAKNHQPVYIGMQCICINHMITNIFVYTYSRKGSSWWPPPLLPKRHAGAGSGYVAVQGDPVSVQNGALDTHMSR